jgi:hypothetical protein
VIIQQQSSKKTHGSSVVAVPSTSRQKRSFAETDGRAKGLPYRIDAELTRHGRVSVMIRALTFRTGPPERRDGLGRFGVDSAIEPSSEREMHQRVRSNFVAPARTFTRYRAGLKPNGISCECDPIATDSIV